MEQRRERVRSVLDGVRVEINRQRPQKAEQLLRSIREDIDALNDPAFKIEYEVATAENAAARHDAQAEWLFEAALSDLVAWSNAPATLRIRAMTHYGDFLTAARRGSVARRHYESARKIAVEFSLLENIADLQLKLEHIDLQTDQDPQVESYQTLKRVADRLGCTPPQQLAAWIQYKGTLEAMGNGLRYARNKNVASESYVEKLLKEVMAHEEGNK